MQQNVTLDANSVDSFKSWLIDWMVRELGIDRSNIDPSQAFLSYGMDSVQAMTMVGDIEAKLGLRLPPTLAWDYPDIEACCRPTSPPDWPLRQCRRRGPSPRRAASLASVESLLGEISIRSAIGRWTAS